MSTTTPVTAEQLYWMPDDGLRYELVEGELRKMSPSGWKHGAVVGLLHGWLAQHIEENQLGMIFGAETGFLLTRDPDTVRAPDIAFIQLAHLPADDPPEAFWPGPPDLAVEVLSPGDRPAEVAEKVAAWLAAGTMGVWVVDPGSRTVTVHRSATDSSRLSQEDPLDGEQLLPGFRRRVGELFDRG